MALEEYVSIQEVMRALGLSRSGLYALCRRGQFPRGINVGRSRRWAVSELQAWLDAKKSRFNG